MTRIFTGDYSTGDFSQWDEVANHVYHGPAYMYPGAYPARIISEDKDCGYIARFEVRDGDDPGDGGGARSESFGGAQTDIPVGETCYYAWSTKFDPSFQTDHGEPGNGGWGVITQWQTMPGGIGPVLGMGWRTPSPMGDVPGFEPGTTNGYFYLMQDKKEFSGDYSFLTNGLLKIPLSLGNWHDFKMEIKFETDDTGTVRVWHNGALQTLLCSSQFDDTPSTVFTGQTLCGGGTAARMQQGYYRDHLMTQTGILYHTGFRMADSESSL
jgi:hypothetical protein